MKQCTALLVFLFYAVICVCSQDKKLLVSKVYTSSSGEKSYSFTDTEVEKTEYKKGIGFSEVYPYSIYQSDKLNYLKIENPNHDLFRYFLSDRFLLLFDSNGFLIDGGYFGREIYSFFLHPIELQLSENIRLINRIDRNTIHLNKPVFVSNSCISGETLKLISVSGARMLCIYIVNGMSDGKIIQKNLVGIKKIELYSMEDEFLDVITLDDNFDIQKITIKKPQANIKLVFKDTFSQEARRSIVNMLFIETEMHVTP